MRIGVIFPGQGSQFVGSDRRMRAFADPRTEARARCE
jgi:hypothetical protein